MNEANRAMHLEPLAPSHPLAPAPPPSESTSAVSQSSAHVLHVVRTLGKSGGMERNLYRVVKATRSHGVRHSIALLSDFDDVIDFGDLAVVHRIVSPPNAPWLFLRLRRLIASIRPTVIHARNWGAWPDVALARRLVVPRPRLIFSYHGADETEVPRHRRLAFRALGALTDSLFTVSNAARRNLVSTYGLPADRIAILPNGVDTRRFTPRASPLGTGARWVIGSIGRLHAVKNFGLLLEAAALLVGEGFDLEVVLAGDGPDLGPLASLSDRLRLQGRIKFLGHVEDVPAFLRTLDVFALPSLIEAHPNALLEAMATALPCVASDVGGIPEVTDQGRVARLFSSGSARALADALRGLIQDPTRALTMGREARSWIEARYDAEEMLSRYLELYETESRLARGRCAKEAS